MSYYQASAELDKELIKPFVSAFPTNAWAQGLDLDTTYVKDLE